MREIEFWKFFFLERGKVRQTARELSGFIWGMMLGNTDPITVAQ